jgi:integration host factor subunit beta
MTRSQLVSRLQSRFPHFSIKHLETVVDTVLGQVESALSDGRRVELRNFGTFSPRTRQARQGRNPRTGETVAVEQKSVPYFRAGKELRDRLNVAAARV